MARKVIVVPYNEQWKNDFEIIRKYLLTAVRDTVIGIEHIGSTLLKACRQSRLLTLILLSRIIPCLTRLLKGWQHSATYTRATLA